MADKIIPKEALDYLRHKKLKPAFSYKDVWLEEHAYNFTVAKAMQIDLLADLKEAVDAAIEEGQSLGQFRKELKPTLQSYGWWGKKGVTDPKTGERVASQLGSPRRLRTIYETNTRQAYNAGRWERGQKSAAHTHILYLVGPSARHRKQHLAWNGLVLPKDDEFWKTHSPMNGWGCKCHIRFITRQRLERLRREGLPDNTNIVDGRPRGRLKIREGRPTLERREYLNKRTGEVFKGYEGVDPGFEWNPGDGRGGSLSGALVKSRTKFNEAFPAAAPKGIAVSRALKNSSRKFKGAVERALGAIDKVHGDGELPVIPIKTGQLKNYYGVYQRYEEPLDIALQIRLMGGPHVELTAVHEIGHFLDHKGLPGAGMTSLNGEDLIKPLMKAIDKSPEIVRLKELPYSGNQDYLLKHQERFARAYAQYVAVKSKDAKLLGQVKELLNSSSEHGKLSQWDMESFIPIEQEIDKLFKGLGWL